MPFHFTKLENSKSQQRILAYLRDCGEAGATTFQISVATVCVNIATWVSMLRQQGYDIEAKSEGVKQGSHIYRYKLRGEPVGKAA